MAKRSAPDYSSNPQSRRRTENGYSQSQGNSLPGVEEDRPMENVNMPPPPGLYYHDSAGSVDSNGDESIISAESFYTNHASNELMSKFFISSGGPPPLNVEESLEYGLFTRRDYRNLPTPAETVQAMCRVPRNSLMLTLGRNSLVMNLRLLATHVAQWESNQQRHRNQFDQVVLTKPEHAIALEEAKEKLAKAQAAVTDLMAKNERIDAQLKLHTDQAERYSRRIIFATHFSAVIRLILSDDFHPWAGNADIEPIRRALEFTSPEQCLALGSRAQCVAVFRIMDLMRYRDNSYFQGLWAMPPDGSVAEWIEAHGPFPNIKTSRAGQTISQIRKRVANYLGHAAPIDDRPAEERPAAAPARNDEDLAALPHEELLQLQQRLQEIISSRDAGAGPDGGVPGDSGAT